MESESRYEDIVVVMVPGLYSLRRYSQKKVSAANTPKIIVNA
jgi:hypothetical protein